MDLNNDIVGYGGSFGLGLLETMLSNSVAQLGDTNKRLPNVDPFASPYKEQKSIGEQLIDKLFAGGGIIGDIPVEVEGGEVIDDGTGITKVKGKKHEQGGVDANLPGGTKVYSDRIEIDGKTMAERKEQREKVLNKLEKKANSDISDPIAKNTLDRTKDVFSLQEYYDMSFQKMVAQAVNKKTATKPKLAYGADIPPNGDFSNVTWQFEDNIKLPANYYNGKNWNLDNLAALELDADNVYRNNPDKWNDFVKFYTSKYGDTFSSTDEANTYLHEKLADQYVGKVHKTYAEYLNSEDERRVYEDSQNVPGENLDNIQGRVGNYNNGSSIDALLNGNNADNSSSGTGTGTGTGIDSNRDSAYTSTIGNVIGMSSTIFGGLAPASTTLANRMGDRENTSFFKQYGNNSLETNRQAQAIAKQIAKEYTKDIDLSSSGAYDRNRMSARTINVQRALDTVTHMQDLKARENISKSLIETLMGLENQRSNIQLNQDQVRMTAEERADLENRQDRDAFYTNLGQDFMSASLVGQKAGKDINQDIYNRLFMNLLPSMTVNNIGIGMNSDASDVYFYDSKGHTKSTSGR